MAGRTKGLFHCQVGAEKEIRIRSHVTGYEYGLTNALVFIRYLFMPRRKSPRRTFPVYTQFLCPISYRMFFKLGDVMGYVIDQVHAQFFGRFAQYFFERFPYPVHDALTVSPGVVCGTCHLLEV